MEKTRIRKKGKDRRQTEKVPLREKIKEAPFLFVLYFLLRAAVIVVAVFQILNHDYMNAFLCFLALGLFLLPSIIERDLKIDIPNTLEGIMLFFIFASLILGEIHSYYMKYPIWDTLLHTTTGFLSAAVGFSLADLLNNSSRKIKLSPIYLCLVSFCFSMTIGVMWEFLEFGIDWFFGTDMQKDYVVHTINTVLLDKTMSNTAVHIGNIESVTVNGMELGVGGYIDIGLIDTIKDMAVTFVGSIVFNFFGFFYVSGRSRSGFAARFIPKMMDEEFPLQGEVETAPEKVRKDPRRNRKWDKAKFVDAPDAPVTEEASAEKVGKESPDRK